MARKAPEYIARDQQVLAAVAKIAGKDEGGDGEGLALKSEILKALHGTVAEGDVIVSLLRLCRTRQLIHSLYGYHVPSKRQHG